MSVVSSALSSGPLTRPSYRSQAPRGGNCLSSSRGNEMRLSMSSTSTSLSIPIWPSPSCSSRRVVVASSTAEPAAEQEAATTSPSSSCRARSALSGTDLAAWDSASSLVAEQLQIAGSEADDLLEVAFGWGKSTYWRGSVDEAMPDAAAVSSSIAFLRDDLGMTVDEVLAVLRSFPETLNLSAEDQLKKNVEKLAKDWKIQGPAAKGCVKRTPRLLGYTVDCAGDCIGLCDRCWVRF